MRIVSFIAAIAIVVVTSCSTKQNPTEPRKKILRLSVPEEPITLDPRRGGDALSSQLHFMLFEGLTSISENGEACPAQSHQIDISSDKLTYTFHLGRTKWSDGSSVTAYDFEKAWKDILSPSFPAANAHLLYCISGAERAKKGLIPLSEVGITAKDPFTLIVHLSEPTPYFLKLVSFCVFYPICKMKEEEDKAWSFHAYENFVCNGPFKLSNWKHHNELSLIKNPYYRATEAVHLDGIRIQVIASEMTAFQMYENGELDFLGHPFNPIPLDAIESLNGRSELKSTPSAATSLIAFNSDTSFFKNEHLRKAFALSIDRKAIVQHMTQQGEVVATDAVPPILKGNQASAFYIDSQKENAQKHLQTAMQELGITLKDLQNLTFYYSQHEGHHKVAQVLQQQWLENLGVFVKLQSTEHKTLLDRLTKRDYSFALTIWRAQYFDPLSILERFKHKENKKNYAGWYSQHYAALLEKSLHQSGKERLTTLEAAEKLLMEELPVAPLYHWSLCFLCSSKVNNIELSPVGGIFFERLSLKDGEL